MVQFYRPVLLDSSSSGSKGPGPNPTIRGWVDPELYHTKPSVMDHADPKCSFVSAVEMLLTDKGGLAKSRLVWAGDYAEHEVNSPDNLYKMCTKDTCLIPEESDMSFYAYIVNHTKGQFVNKERALKYTNLHPLPLLTADGNGFGGQGEYPTDHKLLGYWARDEISLVKHRPAGLVEIIFDLA